jgi:tetratricopeptide (TPR) repeat protein
MRPILALLLLVLPMTLPEAHAAQGLTPNVHRRLIEIREQMDSGAYRASLARLEALARETAGTPYALAVVRQHLGYVHLALEDYRAARSDFLRALEPGVLPEDVERNLHLVLAQVHLRLDMHRQAVQDIETWLPGGRRPTPSQRVLAAQVFHAAGRTRSAIAHLEQAVEASPSPEESWLRSLLAMYLEAERSEEAGRLLHDLVRRFPDRALYWKYLAQIHLQAGREQQAVSMLALAYRKGLLERQEFTRFAGLYARLGVPEKAARLLRQWRESRRLAATPDLLAMEADLWTLARERKQALVTLRQRPGEGRDGRLAFREGSLLFEEGRWIDAADAFRMALRRGGLEHPGQAQLLLGVAALRCGDLRGAESALRRALGHPEVAEHAGQWLSALREVPTPKTPSTPE